LGPAFTLTDVPVVEPEIVAPEVLAARVQLYAGEVHAVAVTAAVCVFRVPGHTGVVPVIVTSVQVGGAATEAAERERSVLPRFGKPVVPAAFVPQLINRM
jgi:hypothetical protein